MNYESMNQATKLTGLSYLGKVASSAKIAKGLSYGEQTYILYLAPAKSSGYEVCPLRTPECTNACLNESGHNRIDRSGRINNSRVRKTKLLFEHREFFMKWLVDEIQSAKIKAENEGFKFSVRLNGTSDIDPSFFKLDGKNILEIFPDVQFYDYTKVIGRTKLVEKYDNYDITYSFSGHNLFNCLEVLNNKSGKVAVVFEGKVLPKTFMGYEVIDGDKYDMRYIDPNGVIVGLKFKKVRNDVDFADNAFIIAKTDKRSVYETETVNA